MKTCKDCPAPVRGPRSLRCEPCNRAAAVLRTRTWQKANPQKHRQHSRAQQHRLRARAHGVKSGPIQVSFEGETCAWCETAPAEVVDHVIPLAHGGSDQHTNKVPACRSCNTRKADMTPLEFLCLKS